MDSPHFICPFWWWTFGLLLPFGYCWIVLIGNHFRCIQICLANIEESGSNSTCFPSALDPAPWHRLPAPLPHCHQFQFHLLPVPLLLPNINQQLTLPASISGSCCFLLSSYLSQFMMWLSTVFNVCLLYSLRKVNSMRIRDPIYWFTKELF